MTVEIRIKPLSINKAWQGRRFRTYEYIKFTEEFLYLLPEKTMIEGDTEISLEFFLNYPKKSDLDNFIKPIFDILVKKKYITDDRYVYKLTASKTQAKVEKVKITIKQIKI